MATKLKLETYGITVAYQDNERWSAVVSFITPGKHGESDYIEGTIGPKYTGDLLDVVRLAKASAEAIGVIFENPRLYVEGDGELPGLPDGWRNMVTEVSAQLGWPPIYLLPH